jgi:hypothetical protein
MGNPGVNVMPVIYNGKPQGIIISIEAVYDDGFMDAVIAKLLMKAFKIYFQFKSPF